VKFLRYILELSNWYRDWGLVNTAAVEADRLGFWGIAMPDHYLRAEGRDDATLDSWFALAHLASTTKTVHVGTMVTPIPFRPPAILAKMVATLDVISNGRTFLGVGAGWSRREFEAYGQWDGPAVRVSRTEEGVRLILSLWTERKTDFQGKYYRSKEGVLQPKPIQKPHPPLLFGGSGPRMLKLAAKYGDIIFLPPEIKPSLKEAKDTILKAAKESKRTTPFSFAGTSPSNIGGVSDSKYDRKRHGEEILEAEKNGCEYFVLTFPEDELLRSMSEFAREMMPNNRKTEN
jgi:alkanesulfonate monooxygenase SsuD/methylene tetrahydromethanopterin reductase-like flavin-dependent oxidoreductase (luciferase family)